MAAIVALLAGSQKAVAQTTTTEGEAGQQNVFPVSVYGIGLSASLCDGMGLSFRHHLALLPIAYQITGGIWKTKSLSMSSIGASVQYDLTLSSYRLYAIAGGGYYYYGANSNELHSPSRFGLGIGYEVPFSKNIGVSGDLMITLFGSEGDILPLPSVGVLVFFK
jgi:hypothetical protein